jgi:hypothetical protein
VGAARPSFGPCTIASTAQLAEARQFGLGETTSPWEQAAQVGEGEPLHEACEREGMNGEGANGRV